MCYKNINKKGVNKIKKKKEKKNKGEKKKKKNGGFLLYFDIPSWSPWTGSNIYLCIKFHICLPKKNKNCIKLTVFVLFAFPRF